MCTYTDTVMIHTDVTGVLAVQSVCNYYINCKIYKSLVHQHNVFVQQIVKKIVTLYNIDSNIYIFMY